MNNNVIALAVSGSDLYAGGVFAAAGETNVNYIAKWDGNTWSALGSGVNNSGAALAVSGTNLFVGGTFTTAGDKVSAYVARAVVEPPPEPPTILTQPQSQVVDAGTNFTFSVIADGTPPLSYQWRKDGIELSDGLRISGAITANLTIANVQTNDASNYTVVVSNAYGSITSSVAVLT